MYTKQQVQELLNTLAIEESLPRKGRKLIVSMPLASQIPSLVITKVSRDTFCVGVFNSSQN